MINAKVLVLITGTLFLATALLSGREARAEERAEKAAERAEKRAEKAERARERAEERAEKRAKKKAKERAQSTKERAGGGGPEKVTLKIKGGQQAEFSGTCAVGEEEHTIEGRAPQSFDYSLEGRNLECGIQNQGSGPLEVALISGDDRSVYKLDGRGGTIKLVYTKNGISSSISSGSGGQTSSSSSQVSVVSTRTVGS